MLLQPAAQRDRGRVVGDVRFPALRLAGFRVQPGDEDPIVWQVDHCWAVFDGTGKDLWLR